MIKADLDAIARRITSMNGMPITAATDTSATVFEWALTRADTLSDSRSMT